jgi:hypothetical protein
MVVVLCPARIPARTSTLGIVAATNKGSERKLDPCCKPQLAPQQAAGLHRTCLRYLDGSCG